MAGVAALQKTNLNEGPQLVRKATKLLTIVGQFGKACDFGGYLTAFKGTPQLSWYKGKSVDGMMVELCCKFTSPKQPTPVRAAAREAVCAICYAYPANYLREDVVTAIQFVLENDDQSLWGVLLENLESFIRAGEKSSDDPSGLELGSGVESGTQRLGGTYQATGSDSAYASLTQRFLPDILRIALGSTDEIALTAARMIASINTQGIAHPGLSAPSLVALQTCPTTAIAKMAFLSYKDSWTKHESTLEKTLLKSVREAFEYQREVFQNTAGCTGHPPVAKLHYFWDVLKIGEKVKSRKKFFANLCADLDFDPNKLTTAGGLTKHLLYVRFCVENIALFDPDTIGEALQIMVCLEKAFAGTGTAIAQAIEQDVLRLQVPSASQVMPDAGSELVIALPVPTIEPARLQQLAISAQILSLIFETRSYIRRMYMLAKYSGKPKAAHKDEKVKALKATNAPSLSDAYHNRVRDILDGAADEASQRITCSAFVELVSVDNEVKVATEEEEEEVDHDDEDDAVSQVSGKSPGPRGKKRKSMDSLKGPAKKRGRPKKTASVGVGAEDEDELSWA
jgi:cohesin loading factor subunit SCC2